MQKKITIIGAGLAGTYLAIVLGRQGYSIDIFESRPDPREQSINEGKSYSISLYNRAILALKKIGLWERVKNASLQIETNVTCLPGKKVKIDHAFLYTIHRTRLNRILLDELKKLPHVKITCNTRLIGIEKRSRTIYLQDVITKKIFYENPDCIIGADGIHSVVRSELQRGLNSTLSQEHFGWGYKKVDITAEEAQLLNLQPKSTYHWPADNALLIAYPNEDGSFILMFNMKSTGQESAETLRTKSQVKKFLARNFPEFMSEAETIAPAFIRQPFSEFITIYSTPWYFQDFMVYLGDAAHAVIPFYGQGVCAAFEDCLLLQKCLQRNNNWEKAFTHFQKIRKPDTDVLAYLSKKNFHELRDKTDAYYYVLRDTLDIVLNKLSSGIWPLPLSKRIVHNNDRYIDAYQHLARQRILTKYTGIDLLLHLFAKGLSIFAELRAVKSASRKAVKTRRTLRAISHFEPSNAV